MLVIVAAFAGDADGLQQLFSIVGKDEDRAFPVIVHPNALFGIVRADQNFVNTFEFTVPARPVIHEIALAIDNKNQMLPAIVHALMGLEFDVRLSRTGHGAYRSVSRRDAGHGNREPNVAAMFAEPGYLDILGFVINVQEVPSFYDGQLAAHGNENSI